MVGFATGFHTGASVVERGQRAQRDQQAHDLLQQARAIDLANAQLNLDQNLLTVANNNKLLDVLKDTAPTPGQQLAVAGGGNQFFSDPQAAQMAAEQERTIAEMTAAPAAATPGERLAQAPAAPQPAWAAGGQVFGEQAAALAAADQYNSINAKRERAAAELTRQGRLDDAGKLIEQVAKDRQEGWDKALDVILAGGDSEAAKAAYNRLGTDRLGPNDDIRVVRTFEHKRAGYGAIPSAEVQIVRNGQVVQHIPDVFQARYFLGNPEKMVELAKQEYQAGRDVKADDRAERQVAVAEKNAETNERWRRDQADAARRRNSEDPRRDLTLADETKYHEAFEKMADSLFEGGLNESSEQAEARQRRRGQWTQQVHGITRLAFGWGVPVTPQEVALVVGVRDPARLQPRQGRDGRWYEFAYLNGRWIPRREIAAPAPKDAQEPDAAAAPGEAGAGDQAGSTARKSPTPPERPAAQPVQVGDPDAPLPPGIEAAEVDARAKRLTEERKAQAEAQERQRAEREAQRQRESEEEAAELERKREEVRGLTPERIAALTPEDAQRIYREYADVLTAPQWAHLRRRLR